MIESNLYEGNQNINDYPLAIEGEGGHSSFAPNSDLEIELLQHLRNSLSSRYPSNA